MIFLWDWDEAFVRSLDAAGLLSNGDGIKFRQSPWSGARDKFNEQIKPNDALHSFIFEQKRPFAIDRGVGGSNYDPYPWDQAALQRIEACLGERFLGVQLHEWIGNVSADVRLLRQHGFEGVHEGNYATRPRLQYGLKAHYWDRPLPSTPQAFLELATRRLQAKLADVGHLGYLVEGHDQSYARGFSHGMRTAFAEVGNQVPLASLQVACLRGAARVYGKPWGLYHEPFAKGSFTHYAAQSLWRRPRSELPFDPTVGHGGHFGSSRALQRRLLYYALVSGAAYFGQEYGYENTFYDPDEPAPKLTPYGQVLKEAVELNRRRMFGTPWRPVRLAIADEYWPLRTRDVLRGSLSGWETFEVPAPDSPVIELLQACFLKRHWKKWEDQEAASTEWRTLPANDAGDVFEVVPASRARTPGDYALTLYCGGDAEQARRLRDSAGPLVWVDEAGVKAAMDQVRSVVARQCPLHVEGEVLVTFNRLDSSWLVGLFNPFGVSRTAEAGDVLDAAEARPVQIHLGDAMRLREEWTTASDPPNQHGAELSATVEPGGVRLLEFEA